MVSPNPVGVAGVVLTPGSGGLADHPTLVAIEQRLVGHGISVLRYDFEYRRAGKRSPGRADRLVGEMVEVIEGFATELGVDTTAIVAGGRSMGGRVCSMAAAGSLADPRAPKVAIGGLVLLSYPLHPPGKPDRLRVDHWPNITVPTLFVSGNNDPFGLPATFDEHLGELNAPVSTVWLNGGAHDPKRQDHRLAIVDAVESWIMPGADRPD